MSGPIGLHGGGEYVAGDEPFLDALLVAATARVRDRAVRVVVLPTAASRGRPDLAAANGVAAFERRAAAAGSAARIEVARVVDGTSANDGSIAALVAAADLIHLPGGDPDLIPTVLGGSRVLAAMLDAWRGGAVVAGASAGAMALAEWTWTPRGGTRGLGLIAGLAVVPHYDDVRRTTWQRALTRLTPGRIGYLGLDERTGVIGTERGPDGSREWRVAGPGAASWFAAGSTEPVVARAGETLDLAI